MRCYLRFQSASGFGGESGLGLRIWRKNWAYWSDTSSLQSKTVLYRWKNVVMELIFVFKKPLSRNVTSFSGSERTSRNAKILKVVSLKFKILLNLQPSTFPSKSSIFTGKSCGFEQKCHLQSCQYYTNEKMLICSLELDRSLNCFLSWPKVISSTHWFSSDGRTYVDYCNLCINDCMYMYTDFLLQYQNWFQEKKIKQLHNMSHRFMCFNGQVTTASFHLPKSFSRKIHCIQPCEPWRRSQHVSVAWSNPKTLEQSWYNDSPRTKHH